MNFKVKQWLAKHDYVDSENVDDATAAKAFQDAVDEESMSAKEMLEVANLEDNGAPKATPASVFGGRVDVKAPSARYCEKRYTGKHVKTGMPVQDEHGREVETPSQRDYAKVGAFMKHHAARNGLNVTLSEHERSLVDEMYAKDTWVGEVNGQHRTDIRGVEVKALLNDNTSNGSDVVPIWFDTSIIQFPLLNGEIQPFVDNREMPRSNVVNSASVGNPTITWSNQGAAGEGTALTLFNTAGLCAPLNSTVYPVTCGLTVGRDEMADSIVDLGRILVENIGQSMAAGLDYVVVAGDGTTQPQGIINATGISSVPSTFGPAGSVTLGDLQKVMFSLNKPYRRPSFGPCYLMNDVMYLRCRQIPIGPWDSRRVLGADDASYKLLEHTARISVGLPDSTLIFGALKKYRLYRRTGLEVTWTREGETLLTAHLALLVVRGRYAGRVMDTAAFVQMSNLAP